jgi:hypothetical protein
MTDLANLESSRSAHSSTAPRSAGVGDSTAAAVLADELAEYR